MANDWCWASLPSCACAFVLMLPFVVGEKSFESDTSFVDKPRGDVMFLQHVSDFVVQYVRDDRHVEVK